MFCFKEKDPKIKKNERKTPARFFLFATYPDPGRFTYNPFAQGSNPLQL